jgi:hypothetical protein
VTACCVAAVALTALGSAALTRARAPRVPPGLYNSTITLQDGDQLVQTLAAEGRTLRGVRLYVARVRGSGTLTVEAGVRDADGAARATRTRRVGLAFVDADQRPWLSLGTRVPFPDPLPALCDTHEIPLAVR